MATIAADFSHARRSDWSVPIAGYVLFVLGAALALHPAAYSMAQTWVSSSTYHHGIAVAPLALLMILSRPRIDPSTGPLFLLGVLSACLLWLAGHAAGISLIEQTAFVCLLISGAGVFFGAAAFRLWLLPLLFLFFMIPFGETLVPFLQMATARSVVTLLNVAGVTSTLDGAMIETAAGRFHIAEACAGLNFLLAALMIAYVYACQVLRSAGSRSAFILIALTIALVANYLRVFFLILIAELSGMRLAIGPDHLVIGLLFYGLVFFILFWLGGKMNKPGGVGGEHAPVSARRSWRGAIAGLAFVPIIFAALYAHLVINVTPPTGIAHIAPINAPGWRILSGPQNWAPTIKADRMRIYTYDNTGERIYLAIAGFTHDRRQREIVNDTNKPAAENWRRLSNVTEILSVFGAARPVSLDILAGPERRRLITLTAYWRGETIYTNKASFKFAQMKDKLQGRNPPGGIIVIAADYASNPLEGLNRIRNFTGDTESFSDWLSRQRGQNRPGAQ